MDPARHFFTRIVSMLQLRCMDPFLAKIKRIFGLFLRNIVVYFDHYESSCRFYRLLKLFTLNSDDFNVFKRRINFAYLIFN